jgi:prophage tail gpP-like protein
VTGVTITTAGKALRGWESVEIVKSMTSLCGEFSLSQSAQEADGKAAYLPVFPGDRAEIRLEGHLLLTGWVDEIAPKIDPRSHTIGVKGREITSDLVDCGLEGVNGTWKGVTLAQLAAQLVKPFGLVYTSEGGADLGKPFTRFSAEPGDTVFQTITKAANQRGVLPWTTREGALTFIQQGTKRATDRLVLGQNLLSVSGAFSLKDRFSTYQVRGTHATAPGAGYFSANKSLHVSATATDKGVERYRPLVIVGGNDLTAQTAQERANWEALTRAAKSSTMEAVVRGWTQSDGSLWECASLLSLDAPAILGGPSQDLLVSQVRYTLGPDGTRATLSLVSPDAFQKLEERKKTVAKTDPWATVRKAVRGQ